LSKRQKDVIRPLLKSYRDNPKKLQRIPYTLGVSGAPIVQGAPAFFECKVVHAFDPGGDHTLFVGEVIEVGLEKEVAQTLTLKDVGLKYGG